MERIKSDRSKIVKILQSQKTLNSKTNVTVPNYNSIHQAVVDNDVPAIKEYINTGENLDQPDSSPDGKGASSIHIAAIFGHTEIVELLLDGGADPNQADKEGSTPIHAAAFFTHEKILLSLLETGADPNQADNEGRTALELVISPWTSVKWIYELADAFLFKPIGKPLNMERIKSDRSKMANILHSTNSK